MSDPVESVTVALWGTELGDAQRTAQRALDAVPDGWAKVAGEWVSLEQEKVIEWRVVNETNGGISFSADSRNDGRWGITKANEWAERLRGYGRPCHIETWEQTWMTSPSTWSRVDVPEGAKP